LNTYFLEQYKIKKIKEINFQFELYLKKTKEIEKIIFLFKKLFINLKLLKYKNVNNRFFFFKKYYRSFINEQKKFI
jgi:hypothetical protein